MASSVIVDAGFLVALFSRRDAHHRWAASQAQDTPPPWQTCEAALSEAFFLLGADGAQSLVTLIRRGGLLCDFRGADHLDEILALMEKYRNVPMTFADACLVRMTEALPGPVLLSTDRDFHVYRRNSRHVIPSRVPS
jgi:predicted nucleic acid-binding protein